MGLVGQLLQQHKRLSVFLWWAAAVVEVTVVAVVAEPVVINMTQLILSQFRHIQLRLVWVEQDRALQMLWVMMVVIASLAP